MTASFDALLGRRVLVTGGTGFLGSHLFPALTSAGAAVHVFRGDIAEGAALRAAVESARPHLVFHLAAYGTTLLQRDEARMRAVNEGGVEWLWKALDGWPCRIVQTGTCAEYGPATGPLREERECRPVSVYAQTIHAAVSYSLDRARASGRELVVLRPFGPYGPRDRPERLMPHVITGLLAGERVEVTAGAQRRDYSYVDDHIRAMLLAATRPLVDTARVYNVASGVPITVRSLVEAVAAAVSPTAIARVAFGAEPYRPHDLADMYADTTAARRELEYEPAVSLADGLARTVAAYRLALQGVTP